MKNPSFEMGAPAESTGENAVASRCADGVRRVCVGEAHPLRCKAIQVGCWDFGVGVLASKIGVTEVVGEDENKIRFLAHDDVLS